MFARFNRSGMLGLSAFAIASILGATGAAAQNRPVVVYGERLATNIERVPYGDLNLQASTDRKTLYGRVGRAVRHVCNFDMIGIATDYRVCSAGAWRDARPQIDAAMAKPGRLASSHATTSAYIIVAR